MYRRETFQADQSRWYLTDLFLFQILKRLTVQEWDNGLAKELSVHESRQDFKPIYESFVAKKQKGADNGGNYDCGR